MKRFIHPALSVLLAPCALALQPGEIAFTGFNADGSDDLAFVALTDLPAATEIHITDNEWNGTAFNDQNEGVLTWTADTDVSAGTVIVISSASNSARSATTGSLAASGAFNLSGSNEAVFAYEGTLTTPTTFLAMIANEDAAGAGFTLDGTGLAAAAGTAIIFTENEDGMRYVGPRSSVASFAGHLVTLADKAAHWETQGADGTLFLPFDASRFHIFSTQLLVTELLSNQASGGTNDFWELTNIGDQAVDLSGWSWDDDSFTPGTVTIPASTTIAAGESVILTAMDASAFRTWWGLAPTVQVLSDINAPGFGQNDTVALFDASNNEITRFSYAAEGFTKSDGGPSNGGHAGFSAGGSSATQSAVIDPLFGTESPRYTAATVGVNGAVASTISPADIASPGATGLGAKGPGTTLSVTVTPSSFSESATNPAATGTVTRTGDLAGDLEVTLSSSDTTEATVPASVTIPDGAASVAFDLTAVDDSFPDGNQTVTLSASASDALPGSTDITVEDDGDMLTINVMLTEVQSDQNSTAAGSNDYWELTNFGENPVDLSGYTWHDSGRSFAAASAWALPEGTTLAAGESAVFTTASPEDFRANWGLPASVQVFQAVGAPGLGKGDGVSFFDAEGNEIFFFSYAVGGFTREDGSPSIGENPLDPNDATDPGHAGLAAGGNETDAIVWVPASGTTTPRYTAATGTNYGTFATLTGLDKGSPGRLDTPSGSLVSIGNASITEGDSGSSVVNVAVTRTDAASEFSVDFAVSGGLADGADFSLTPGTLTFTAGGSLTQFIAVTVNGDTDFEIDETLQITLSNVLDVTGTTTLDAAVGQVTILNDDVVLPPSNSASFSVLGSIGQRAPGVPLSGAEIPAFDPGSKRGFLATGAGVEVIDLTNPAAPAYIGNLSMVAATGFNDISSVDVKNGLLVAGVIATPKTSPGFLVIMDAATGNVIETVTVGPNPDDVTFTPDGSRILVANEGETAGNPDQDTTPGSVSIIDISGGTSNPPVTTAGFAAFNAQAAALKAAGVRIFAGALPEFDFEPEYIAVAPDGLTAMVSLQEANAVGLLDIVAGEFTAVVPMGEKDFSSLRADFSDRDGPGGSGIINPTTGNPVFGLYMPDQIAAFEANGETYYITANEGDDRDDFMTPEETIRLGDAGYDLDDATFPDEAVLKTDARLGRLGVINAPGLRGDTDNDGDVDRILMLGGRSFSILDASGNIVFDSGDSLEMIVASQFPARWDDGRSDNKGPEPEGVTVASSGGRTFAFLGLERSNMVFVFDITNPLAPSFVTDLQNAGDVSPEGMKFIAPADSPNGRALLMVANEVSATLSIYQLDSLETETFTLELFHLADQEVSAAAVEDAPRLSGILNALRAQDLGNDGLPDNSLTLSSGDAIIPGLFFDASAGSDGIADIQIQNELGIQAMALGNHEFDKGTAVLAGLISGSAAGNILGSDFTGTAFPYLSGNLDFTTDANLAPLVTADHQAPQPNKLAATTVIDVNGGKIGVVAATTPALATISSPGGVGIAPSPFGGSPGQAELDALAAVIQADVDALLAAEPTVNKVILLAHMQSISIEQALASRLRHVDIIVAGGSNTRLFDANDRIRAGDTLQGTYPIILSDADSSPVAVVNTDGSYKYLGRLVIDFDAAGHIIPSSYDETVSGAYATDAQGLADLSAAGLIDPQIQQIADEIGAQIIATDGNWFGVTNEFLNGNRSGGGTDGVRSQETNLGNLTADANLFAAKAVDPTVVMSIKNGGGIRASIGEVVVLPGATEATRIAPTANPLSGRPEGGISQNAIQAALAFNNALTLLTLTKEEIVALLEHGVAAATNDNSSAQGRFPQVAGLEVAYDLTAPTGSRVFSAAIVDGNGALIAPLVAAGNLVGDPEEEFRIVTLNFMANFGIGLTVGGDDYPFPPSRPGDIGYDPAQGARINRVDLEQTGVKTGTATFADDGTEQDALAEYLAATFPDTGSAFAQADVGREFDTRLQNLAFRSNEVLDGAPLGFDLWLALNSYTSTGADSDHNGVPDLVEFFFNQSPNDSSDLGNLPVLTAANGDKLLSFTTLDAAAGVTGTLQVSDDLGASDPWAPAVEGVDYEVFSSSSADGETTTTLRLLGHASRGFWRFEVN
ncbi:MAG: choice-of-anchor I family protein [Luteolibacter sp.]